MSTSAARMASDIPGVSKCTRCRAGQRVAWLVEKHQFLCDARHMHLAKLKMILAHPGILELLALHRADALACGRSTDHVDYCQQLLQEGFALTED